MANDLPPEEAALDAAMEAAIFKAVQPDKPKTAMYHYTDAAGFYGIFESKELWATHFEHLNDQSELRLGEDLVLQEATSVARELPQGSAQRFLIDKFVEIHPTVRLTEVGSIYVASLSEHGDQLSQWRGYGSDGSGYAVGFRSIPVPVNENPDAAAGVTLLKCEYEPQKFRLRIRQVLLEVAKGFEHFVATDAARGRERFVGNVALSIALRRIAVEIPRLKHQTFHEEAEWRMVVFTVNERDREVVKFRPSRGRLVPYVPLSLAGSDGTIDLASVVIGPSQHVRRARQTTEMFLRHRGYPTDTVRSSAVPYRGGAV